MVSLWKNKYGLSPSQKLGTAFKNGSITRQGILTIPDPINGNHL
jgi:hypothetical protein